MFLEALGGPTGITWELGIALRWLLTAFPATSTKAAVHNTAAPPEGEDERLTT